MPSAVVGFLLHLIASCFLIGTLQLPLYDHTAIGWLRSMWGVLRNRDQESSGNRANIGTKVVH